MSQHKATVRWMRAADSEFAKGRYSREHIWAFDCGIVVPASPSPSAVPAPYSNPNNVDPEEAFVAAISSCHMLTFLYLASKQGFQIDSYDDDAVGIMTKNARDVLWVSSVTLNPRIVYSGVKRPTVADEEHLHHEAHEQCFISNSIKTDVRVRSR